jgi:hypothetical protein
VAHAQRNHDQTTAEAVGSSMHMLRVSDSVPLVVHDEQQAQQCAHVYKLKCCCSHQQLWLLKQKVCGVNFVLKC